MGTPNVFKPSFGNRPDRVVGRDQVVQGICNGLTEEPGSRERSVLILGQRGMGKTSLLLEVADRVRSLGFVPVRVTHRTTMLEDIIGVAQLEGSKALGSAASRVSSLSADAFGFTIGLSFTDEVEKYQGFRVKLSLLCDRLAEAGLGLLILLDEVQANSDEMRTLATTYQELAGDGKNIALVMAGLPSSISKVLNDKTLTFLNRARRVHLGPISTNAVGLYFEDAFKRVGRSISHDVLLQAAESTRGFPYLLQLVGYHLVRYSDIDGVISERVLEAAVKEALDELAEDVFETTLKPLSRKDIEFLKAMAQDEGVSAATDIMARLGVADNYYQPYRARLLATGIIEAPRDGELEFAVPYLADYLAGRL